MKAVIIIGRLRTGGAAVASALVRMGFSPGVSLTAPAPPTWRLDWDDYDMTRCLLNRPLDEAKLRRLVDIQVERAGLWKSDMLMKNAFLCFAWDLVLQRLLDHGLHPFVIRTERSETARQVSLSSTFHTVPMGRELDLNVRCDKIAPDYIMQYEALMADPDGEMLKLTRVMGFNDEMAHIGAEGILCPGLNSALQP